MTENNIKNGMAFLGFRWKFEIFIRVFLEGCAWFVETETNYTCVIYVYWGTIMLNVLLRLLWQTKWNSSRNIASTNTLFRFYKNIEAEISVIFCVEGL